MPEDTSAILGSNTRREQVYSLLERK
jgi:hypothetical protein